MTAAAQLTRKTFTTSRLAEFCSLAELVRQTGHPAEQWLLVIAKEVADNALDAAEEAESAPKIEIIVDRGAITIADHGPGIADEIVKSMLDYTTRTSSRAAYVSPTRGAQGNALQTILAMPFALDGGRGETLIESRGVAHRIVFEIDPLRRIPRISHTREASSVKNGVRTTVRWPDSRCLILENTRADFLQLVQTFAWRAVAGGRIATCGLGKWHHRHRGGQPSFLTALSSQRPSRRRDISAFCRMEGRFFG